MKFNAMLFAVVLAACTGNKNGVSEPEEYPVTEAIKIDTISFIEYTAEINAVQNVEIRARVAGYLEQIHIDEGKYVKKDQLLFSINNSEYAENVAKARAAHKSAQISLEAAQLELKNVNDLAEKNIVSKTELEMAKNKVEAAKANIDGTQAELSTAQLKLSHAGIKAPFDGIVNRIPHKIGSLIEEGTLLTSISQNDEVFAYFDVSEKEYLNYADKFSKDSMSSSGISLVLANGIVHKQPGKIETMEGEINQGTGNIAFRARFKNPERLLKHGASGKIRIKKNYDNAILVPQKSTFEIQDKIYVYVVNKDSTVTAKNILAVHRIPHLYILQSGLKPGEKLIYEGIQNLREGMKIRPKFIPMSEIIRQLLN
jgi:RND family efflux transporter MFP subunit